MLPAPRLRCQLRRAQPCSAGAGNWLGRVAVGLSFTLGSKQPAATATTLATTSGPFNAWLQYQVKDANGQPVGQPQQVFLPSDNPTTWHKLQLGVRVQQGGSVELTASSAEATSYVMFDNLAVEQTGGLIVQEQHQYAFGAPLPGLSYTVGNRRYRYGYQGQYAEHDDETGFESFELRLYNSRVGRWLSYDPQGQYNSPYVGMGNNPVSGVDPTGGFCDDCPNFMLPGATVTGTLQGARPALITPQLMLPALVAIPRLVQPIFKSDSFFSDGYATAKERDWHLRAMYNERQAFYKQNGKFPGQPLYHEPGLEPVYPEQYIFPVLDGLKGIMLARTLGRAGAVATMGEATVIGADGATALNAKNLLPEDGVYQVVMHGSIDWEHFLEVGTTVTTKVPAKSMARSLLQMGYEKGTPIRLVTCHAGVHADGLAYQLSRYLKAPVTAATTEVGVLPGGEFFFVPSSGSWRTFYNTTITR